MAPPIVLDFETYYHPKERYSLRVMSIEQYVLDERFQVHGCTVIDEQYRGFLSLPDFQLYLKQRDWAKRAVLSHNARFDMAILCWRFGVMPGLFIDTLSIANQFILPHMGRVSLDKCCEHLGIAGKNLSVLDRCVGLRTEQIREVPGLWDALCQYAVGDGDKAREIYRRYWPRMRPRERVIMDWSIRNYLRGRLRLDVGILQENLYKESTERQALLDELGLADAKPLRSNKAFIERLQGLGVAIEYKANSKSDGIIPAFAKDDEFMRQRQNDPDPQVRLAIKARLAFASNLEVSRTERLIAMARATGGKLLVPLNFHAAHTGRFGGAEGVNPQNYRKDSLIRHAITAPAGMAIVSVDASQIEARLVGWLAGCRRIVEAFAEGRDLYSEFASIVFGVPVNKRDYPKERQIGKVSILQLGYQSGHSKLQRKLESSGGIIVSEEEAYDYVRTYRTTYHEVPELWRHAERTLRAVAGDQPTRDFRIEGLTFTRDGILLPSKRWIYYPQLHVDEDSGQLLYWAAKYKVWSQLYGGKIIENIIQAIARDVVTETHLKYVGDTVMQNHDEIAQLVPEAICWERYDETIAAMSTAPDWLVHPQLGPPPLSAEGYCAYNYVNPD